MFIPIGLDQSEVRRTPWISYGLIAANVLVFAALWLAQQQSDVPRRVEEQGRSVLTYLSKHPYLEVPAELAPHLSDNDRRVLAQEREEIARARRMPADWEIARQQKELDDRVRKLFATVRDSPIRHWGFVPAKPNALHLLTYMFVHGGWLHLIGNMIFLFLSGPFVEDAYGRVVYPLLYLLSGLVAAGVHAVHNPSSQVPTVGASGAIAGIMGAFLVRYAKRRIVFLWMPFFPIPWLARRIRVPAFLYLPFWFFGQVLLSSVSGEESGVAVWTHIGGFLFGFIVAFLIAATGFESKFIEPGIEKQVGGSEHAGLLRAIEAGTRGDLAEARRATGLVLAQDPANLDARRYAYEVALESRNTAEIGAQATRLLEAYVQQGQTELASGLIREATESFFPSLPPRFLLRAADFLARQGNARLALDLLGRLQETSPNDPAALRGLLQSAELRMKAGDLARAREDLLRAQSHAAYGPEWKALIDRKLADLAQARSTAATAGYRGWRPS